MAAESALATVEAEIRSAIASLSTDAAVRIAAVIAGLGPLTVHLFDEPMSNDVAVLIQDCFRTEPLGQSVGKTKESEREGFNGLVSFLTESARSQRTLKKQTSVVVKAGDKIVALSVSCPRNELFEYYKHDENEVLTPKERVERSFRLLNNLGVPELEKRGLPFDDALEIVFGVVHPDFRGPLRGDTFGSRLDFKVFSIFQRLTFLVEELARESGYTSLFSHSHDGSAMRRAECGWEEIVSIPFAEYPKNVAVSPVAGRSHKFMYKRLK